MGLAERKAEEIRQRQENQALTRRWHLERKSIIAKSVPVLFDSLAECLTDEVSRFSRLTSSAKGLHVTREGEKSLIVHNAKFPKVTLSVSCTADGSLVAELTELPSGLDARHAKAMRFRVSSDEQLEPCFTDGGEQLHPQEVADRLLDRVFSFFG
jgi:hypothetical protein